MREKSIADPGPREWSFNDLFRCGHVPTKSLKKAMRELGYVSPLTARQVYRLIERTFQLSGAHYARGLPKR